MRAAKPEAFPAGGISARSAQEMGDQVILQSGVVKAPECLRYAMSLPTSVVITGCDSTAVLRQATNAARDFRPMTDEEKTALLARTADVAANGKFELYKTSHRFDATWKNPQWLGQTANS
jgi:hypothetical protein